MTLIEYLKIFIAQRLYANKSDIISAFAIVKQPPTTMSYVGQIFKQPWGYDCVVDIDGVYQLQPIQGTKSDTPLLTFKDRVMIDQTWVPNAPSIPVETTVGNVLFNAICILTAFGPKYPFILGSVSVSSIEAYIAPKLLDTPMNDYNVIDTIHQRDPKSFYVDEYIRFIDALQFISNLSLLTTWSATPKSLVSPPGLKEFKDQLLIKYQGRLTDPIELSKYEQELLDFDREFLKDDPAYGTFLKGKILHTARKKMYLSVGADKGFTDSLDVVPVTNSLEEGWPTDPVQFTAMMNSLRSGSYSRGSETVKGGVSAKVLLRAANNYTIVDTDCGSLLGITRTFHTPTIHKLIGRYVLAKTPVLVSSIEEAQQYLDSKIIVRSPMYCRLEGPNLCRICAGEKLFKFPTGITIPLTEISSIILATSLSAMHSNTLSISTLDIHKHFT